MYFKFIAVTVLFSLCDACIFKQSVPAKDYELGPKDPDLQYSEFQEPELLYPNEEPIDYQYPYEYQASDGLQDTESQASEDPGLSDNSFIQIVFTINMNNQEQDVIFYYVLY